MEKNERELSDGEKEYIELRSSLDALCRSFIENKETIRDTFPWDSVYLYPVCGAVFTDKRRRADGEQLKYCRDLLRDETGVFSSFGASYGSQLSLCFVREER